LGLRPRYSFSGNICFKYSAFCLCSVRKDDFECALRSLTVVLLKERVLNLNLGGFRIKSGSGSGPRTILNTGTISTRALRVGEKGVGRHRLGIVAPFSERKMH
jgi:hypothetical protein